MKVIQGNLDDFYAAQRGNAVSVQDIVDGSQAQAVGLKKGDLIIRYDNVRITNSQQLIREAGQKADREKFELIVVRDGKPLRFSLKGGRLGVQISSATISQDTLEKYLRQIENL